MLLHRRARNLAAGFLLAAGVASAQEAPSPRIHSPYSVIEPRAPIEHLKPAAPNELPALAPGTPATTTVAPAPCPPTVVDCPCESFDWSKVPANVRPVPRLGYFIPPPEGCAFYTAFDAFRGIRRERAPAAPYPPLSPSPGTFFDADYRFLDSPTYNERDWLDCLKRRHLGENWMVSTGGEFRYRLMDEIGSRLTATTNNHHLIRTRVYGDIWYRDRLRLYAEFIEAHIFDPNLPPLPIDENPADIQNLFFDLKLFDRLGAPAYLRIGRQELIYGSQRLISPLDWANTRRTFQGTKLFWTREKWNLDLFWVKPVITDPTAMDWWDDDQNFYGAWATYKPKPGTTRDFYVLNLHQSRPVATGAGGLQGGFWYSTFGTRWAGDIDGTFLYDFEGMAQTGIRANESVYAFAATAGLGYRPKKVRWNPTAWAYYDFASGTPDPTVAGTVNTFNPLFPFGHYYLGYNDFVGRQNIHDISAQFSLNPMPFVTVLFQYHHFALVQPRDALYNAAGVPIRQDPTGASGSHVGDEFDFLANIHLNRHHDVLFGFSYFVPGAFLRNAPGGVLVDPSLYYFQYSYKW